MTKNTGIFFHLDILFGEIFNEKNFAIFRPHMIKNKCIKAAFSMHLFFPAQRSAVTTWKDYRQSWKLNYRGKPVVSYVILIFVILVQKLSNLLVICKCIVYSTRNYIITIYWKFKLSLLQTVYCSLTLIVSCFNFFLGFSKLMFI